MKLDNWQKEVLEIKGDILLCTGRRVGKTYIMARKAVERMVEKKIPIVIVSLTEDQAMIIHFMALHYIQEKYPKLWDERATTLKRITLKNESTMITRPVGDTGDATRGFEGGVLIVDEASRMPKLFWIAAKPILLTTNGEIWMCSTPFGKQGYFWDKFKESYIDKKKGARFKVFYKSSEEVMTERPLSDVWTKDIREGAIRILKEEKEEMTDLEYGQEYLGLFLDDLRQFFPDELILECMRSKFGPAVKGVSNSMFLGVDVARLGRDDTVLVSVNRVVSSDFEVSKYTLTMVDAQIFSKILTTQTVKHILDATRLHNYKQIFVDDAGVGGGVFDMLLEHPLTKRRVIPINNARKSLDNEEKIKKKLIKEDLYNNLKNLMEKAKITLLKRDDIFQSLKSVQYEYVDAGKMKIFGRDTHIAEALIRAAWCTKDKSLNPCII